MKPHDFNPDSDHDDLECIACAVRVAPNAAGIRVACPAGDCASASNPDRGCVFVRSGSGHARCIWCGRDGGPMPVLTEPDDDLELLGV